MFRRILFLLAVLGSLALPLSAQAVVGNYGLDATAKQAAYTSGATAEPLFTLIGQIVNGALFTVSFVFFGFTMFAGVRWLTARGNEEYVTTAKETLQTSIFGLIVVVMAYALTLFVFQYFNTSGPAATSAPAATPNTGAGGCTSSSQCGDGTEQLCISGQCVDACAKIDGTCGTGTCTGGTVPNLCPGAPICCLTTATDCATDSDCPGEEICRAGNCVDACDAIGGSCNTDCADAASVPSICPTDDPLCCVASKPKY